MTRLPILLTLMVAIALTAAPRKQRTTSRRLTVDREALTPAYPRHIHQAPTPGQFMLAGYDKPVNSRRESLLVTNKGTADVDSLLLDITYLDTSGRQIHRRSIWVGGPFPAGETRKTDFMTWDRQCSFLYRHSAPTRKQHTTYDVKIQVDSLSVLAENK